MNNPGSKSIKKNTMCKAPALNSYLQTTYDSLAISIKNRVHIVSINGINDPKFHMGPKRANKI